MPGKADWVELMPGNILKLRLEDIDQMKKVFDKIELNNIFFEQGNIGVEMSLVYLFVMGDRCLYSQKK